MLSVCKTFEFAAAHRLPHHEGLCGNWHGHNYKLEVEVTLSKGLNALGPMTGMIIDFAALKKIIKENVISKLDHADLNKIWDNPTAELMVMHISNWLLSAFAADDNVRPCRVRLWETSTSYAEWKSIGCGVEKR